MILAQSTEHARVKLPVRMKNKLKCGMFRMLSLIDNIDIVKIANGIDRESH